MPMLKIPYVQEQTPQGTRTMDLYSRLLSERIVMLTGEVNDDVADLITAQLFFLESEDPEKDVRLYINRWAARRGRYRTWRFMWPKASA